MKLFRISVVFLSAELDISPALWSGAAIGPEGLLVFLCGGFGTFIVDRLKLEKRRTVS